MNVQMITGIEPIMVAYETTVLPLNYIILAVYLIINNISADKCIIAKYTY